MNLFEQEFKLNIFKCKEVKTPTKAWEAARMGFLYSRKFINF